MNYIYVISDTAGDGVRGIIAGVFTDIIEAQQYCDEINTNPTNYWGLEKLDIYKIVKVPIDKKLFPLKQQTEIDIAPDNPYQFYLKATMSGKVIDVNPYPYKPPKG